MKAVLEKMGVIFVLCLLIMAIGELLSETPIVSDVTMAMNQGLEKVQNFAMWALEIPFSKIPKND